MKNEKTPAKKPKQKQNLVNGQKEVAKYQKDEQAQEASLQLKANGALGAKQPKKKK